MNCSIQIYRIGNSNSSNVINENTIPERFKAIFLGLEGVGKTSIIYRIVNQSLDNIKSPHSNIEHYTKKIENCILDIYDTTGILQFLRVLFPSIVNLNLIVFVYDVTNRDTFLNIDYIFNSIYDNNKDAKYIVVGNKSASDNREVTIEEGKNMQIKMVSNLLKLMLNLV